MKQYSSIGKKILPILIIALFCTVSVMSMVDDDAISMETIYEKQKSSQSFRDGEDSLIYRPSADYDCDWAVPIGSHYNLVDDVSPDGSSTEIYHNSVNTKYDLYEIPNHAHDDDFIYKVVIYYRTKTGGNGSSSCGALYTHGNRYSEAFTHKAGSSYHTWSWTVNNNPNTSLNWTWNEIDDLRIGVGAEVTSNAVYCTQVYLEVFFREKPTVQTNEAQLIDTNVVDLNGTLTSCLSTAECWFQWCKNNNSYDEYGTNTSKQFVNEGESFEVRLNEVDFNHQYGNYYVYRAVADDGYNVVYGDNISFMIYPKSHTTVTVAYYHHNFSNTLRVWLNNCTGSNATVIRASTTSFPSSPTEGIEIYNDSVWHTSKDEWIINNTGSLSYDTFYYISIWEYAEYKELHIFSERAAYCVIRTPEQYKNLVHADAPTNITNTTVTFNGNLSWDGGEANTVLFEYGTTDSYSSSTTSETSTTGLYDIDVTGLSSGTFYLVRAKANNTHKTAYSTDDFEYEFFGHDAYENPEDDDIWNNVYLPQWIFDYGLSDGHDPGTVFYNLQHPVDLLNIIWYWNGISWKMFTFTGAGSGGTLEYINATADYHLNADANCNLTLTPDEVVFLTYPDAPTNPSLTSNTISWTKGTGADTTVVERNATASEIWAVGDGVEIYNGTGTSVVDTGMLDDGHYTYRLWSYAEHEYDDSLYYRHSLTNITVNSSIRVTTLDGTGVEETNATLRGHLNDSGWYNNATVRFEYGTNTSYGTNSTNQSMNTTDDFNENITGLTSGQLYHYRAFANTTNDSTVGEDKYFLTKPVHPTDFDVSITNYTTMYLSWTKGDGANTTYIERNTSSNWSRGDGTVVYNGSGTYFNDSTGTLGTTYYYQAWSYAEWTVNPTLHHYSDVNDSDSIYFAVAPVVTTNGTTQFGINNSALLHGFLDLDGGEDCSVWFEYNTTTSYGINTSNQTKNTGETYSITTSPAILIYGQLYHYRAVANNSVSICYGDDAVFLNHPTQPIVFNVDNTHHGVCVLNLSWSAPTGANTTYIERNTSSSWSRGDGTVVYNGSGTYFNDTNLTMNTRYYYKAWGYANWTVNGTTLHQYSYRERSRDELTDNLDSAYNGSSTYNTTTFEVNLSWTRGNNSDREIVVQNNNTWSTSPSDGWVRYNDTDTYINLSVNDTAYFTVWSYNDTCNVYSLTGLHINWGCVGLNVFDVNTELALSDWDVEVSNSEGTVSYVSEGNSNTFFIAFENIPFGEDTLIRITKDSYQSTTRYSDLIQNSFYNYTIYLAPVEIPQDPSDPPPDDTEDCTLRYYSDTKSVTNPAVDLNIYLTYYLIDIVSVETWEETADGNYWKTVPADDYTYNHTNITIDADALGSDTELAKATYTYWDCTGVLSRLYYIQVLNELNQPISGAKINVRKYIDATGKYESLGIIITDGYGFASIWLLPNSNLKLTVTADGYTSGISDWETDPNYYGQSYPKIIQLESTYTPPPTQPIYPSFTGERSGNYINVSFYDAQANTTDCQIYVYETNLSTGVRSLYNTSLFTSVTYYANLSLIANVSNSYEFILYYNHTTIGSQRAALIFDPAYTTNSELGGLLDALVGSNPFGWLNFLLWLFMIAGLYYADRNDAGKIMVMMGGLFLFFNMVLGWSSTLFTIAGGVLPALFIVVGILMMVNTSRKQGGT